MSDDRQQARRASHAERRTPARLTLLGLFALALSIRIAAVAIAGFSSTRFGDSAAYRFAARELVRTGRYPAATEPFYFRAPGYPTFIALATAGHPDAIALDKVENAVLGSVAVLLVAALSARIFRRRGLALATGVVAAMDPGLVFVSTDVQSEPLCLVLLLGAGYLLLVAQDRPSSNLAVLAGVALASAALTRPSVLALVPLLAAPLFDRRYPMRARAHVAGSAAAGLLIALFPWTLRNVLVFHAVLPVNDAAGSAFYQGNSNWMLRFYDLKTRDEYRAWSAAMFADLDRRTRAIDRAAGGSRAARSREFVREALSERRADPRGTLRLLLLKSWDWLRPWPHPFFWPRWVLAAVGAFYAALTLLAARGLLLAERPGVATFALGVLALSMLAHVALIVVWRYRIPYWDPVLLLYGVSAGDTLLSRWRRRPS